MCLSLQQACDRPEEFGERLAALFLEMHKSLLRGECVTDRRATDGRAITNYFSKPDDTGKRQAQFLHVERFKEGLASDFHLGMKHNALFASALPEICKAGNFKLIAIVRDPVSAIRAWQSVPLPIANGVLPAADKYWPLLNKRASSQPTVLRSQISIYNMLVARFIECGAVIVRYEDMILDPIRFVAESLGKADVEIPSHITISKSSLSRLCTPTSNPADLEIAREYLCHAADDVLALYPSLMRRG